MLLGADPEDLDRLAARHETCAALLARVRTGLRSAPRDAWRGPGAARWWAALDTSILPLITETGVRCAATGRHLRNRARAQRRASLPEPDRSVLRYDRSGDGRWVSLTGAATRATVAVVLVPGVGSDLGDVARLERDAARLWRRLAGHDDLGRPVAVVAWLGYDPPDHVLAGIDPRPADAAVQALRAQVEELRRSGAERVLVVGHSYGGLVLTAASAAGMSADELVLLGAPGLGGVDLPTLGLTDGADLWVARAEGDPISALARLGLLHGPDPAAAGLALPTSRRGHSSYLEDPVLLDALAGLALDDPVPSAHRRAQGQ